MASGAVNLPPGFELDQQPAQGSSAVNLPPGFELDQQNQTPSTDYWKSSLRGGPAVNPTTLPQQIDYGVRKGLQVGMDTINYPFEKAGEALRVGVEGGPMRPSSLAQDTGFSPRSDQPPTNIISYPRKLMQTGAAALAGLPSGNARSYAQQEYNRPQNMGDTTQDMAISLAPGAAEMFKAPTMEAPQPMTRPYQPSGMTTKVISSIFGPSQEAVAARFANPEAIKNAQSIPALAEDMPKTVKMLSDQLSQHAHDAYSALSDSFNPSEGAIPKELVSGVLQKVQHDLQIQGGGVVGPAANKAHSILNGLIDNVNRAGPSPDYPYLSEKAVKDIVNAADQNINWDDQSAETLNNALKSFRVNLDGVLKGQNPQYGELMKPVAAKTDLLDQIKQGFQLKNNPGQGLMASDTTGSKLNTVLNDNKVSTHRALEGLKEATGRDYLNDVKNSKYAEQFQPGATRPNGSRRVAGGGILGAAVGKVFGSPVLGSAVGAGTGAMLDTQGGAMAAKIIDTLSKYAPELLDQLDLKSIRAIRPIRNVQKINQEK